MKNKNLSTLNNLDKSNDHVYIIGPDFFNVFKIHYRGDIFVKAILRRV